MTEVPRFLQARCSRWLLVLFLTASCSSGISADESEGGVDLDRYLGAETLSDLGSSSEEFERLFASTMTAAIKNAPEKIGAVALQSEALIRHEQRDAGGWHRSMWNGWTILVDILGRFDDDLSEEDALSMYMRMYRADLEGVIPVSGSYVTKTKGAMVRDFHAFGGNYRPREAMDHLSEKILSTCGEGEMVFLSFIFARFGDYIRPHQQREVVVWADEVIDGSRPGNPKIAEVIRFGLQMHSLLRSPLDGELLLPGITREEINSKIVSTLKREDISPAWQLGLSGFLASSMRGRVSDSVACEMARLSTRMYVNELPFSSVIMAYGLEAFLACEKQDEEWREIATELAKSWRHRNRLNDQSKKEGRGLNPSSNTVILMMAILCRLGNEEDVDWHYRSFTRTWGAMPGMFVSLVRHGFYPQARRLFLERASDVRFRDDHYRYGPHYDEKLHEAIPGFLNSMKDDEWREYAALLLAGTPDTNRRFRRSGDYPMRWDRINAVAERWEEEGYSWSRPMLVVRDVLATSEGSPAIQSALESHSADLIPHFVADVDKQAESSTGVYWMVRHHFHSAASDLFCGSEFPAQFLWARLVYEEREANRYLLRNGCEAVVDGLITRLNREFAKGSENGMRASLHFCRQVLEGVPTEVYRNDVSLLLNTAVVAHAWCGEISAFNEWWEQLPEERTKFLVQVLSEKKGLVGLAGELLNPRYRDPEAQVPDKEKRRQIFTDIVTTSLVDEGYENLVLMSYGYSRGLLNESDLEQVAGSVADSAPRGGLAYREYFGLLADQNRMGEALKKAERLIDILGGDDELKDGSAKVIAALKIERALMLSVDGDLVKAVSEIDSVEFEAKRSEREFGEYLQSVKAYLKK